MSPFNADDGSPPPPNQLAQSQYRTSPAQEPANGSLSSEWPPRSLDRRERSEAASPTLAEPFVGDDDSAPPPLPVRKKQRKAAPQPREVLSPPPPPQSGKGKRKDSSKAKGKGKARQQEDDVEDEDADEDKDEDKDEDEDEDERASLEDDEAGDEDEAEYRESDEDLTPAQLAAGVSTETYDCVSCLTICSARLHPRGAR